MRRKTSFVVVWFVLTATVAKAETAGVVPLGTAKAGDRVRIRFADAATGRLGTLTGKIVSWNAQALGVRAEGAWTAREVPWSAILVVEASQGTRYTPNPGKGAAIGALVGLLVAAPFGLLQQGYCGPTGTSEGRRSGSCDGLALETSAWGAVIGGGAGALLGLTLSEESWTTIDLDRGRVSLRLQPAPRGLGVGVTLRF